MSLKVVRPHMITINFPGISGVVDVGTPPILADDDDASYVDGDPAGTDYDCQLDALPSYDTGDPINLRVRLSMESTDHTGSDAKIFVFLQDGNPFDITGDFYRGQFSTGAYNAPTPYPYPFDGTIREVVWPLRVRPGYTVADCVSVLMSGTAQVAVNALGMFDAIVQQVRIYEMWLEVGALVLTPAPLRIYPRSSTRIYPRRRTRRPGTF